MRTSEWTFIIYGRFSFVPAACYWSAPCTSKHLPFQAVDATMLCTLNAEAYAGVVS